MGKRKDFNNFRFDGLNYYEVSNQYYSMKRVNDNKDKIVVKVADCHLQKTKFGYALILDFDTVVFLKDWQVDRNYFGNEVLLTKEYFIPKKWGEHQEFGAGEDLTFNNWLNTAILQSESNNIVKWSR